MSLPAGSGRSFGLPATNAAPTAESLTVKAGLDSLAADRPWERPRRAWRRCNVRGSTISFETPHLMPSGADPLFSPKSSFVVTEVRYNHRVFERTNCTFAGHDDG